MKREILAVTLLLLPGCSWFHAKEPTVITKVVEPKVFHPSLPRPVLLEEPYFYVVSEANFDEFVQKIDSENDGVFFAMTPGDYEILATNLQELRRYILQSRQIIVYYRESLGAEDSKKQSPQVTDD